MSLPKREPADILKETGTALTKSFVLAYGTRSALSLVFQLAKIVRSPKDTLKIMASSLGATSLRFGFFVGGFSGLYRLVLLVLQRVRGESRPSNAVFAGAVASLSLLCEEESQRVTIAHYLLVRALQCLYNALKSRGRLDILGKSLSHGDSLLFAISSAQVMYAYTIRPETIPASYYKFILQTGPIDEVVLQEVRKNVRGLPVNAALMNKYVEARGGPKDYLKTPFPKYISNQILHPQQPNWLLQAAEVFLDVFGKIAPVYLSLTFLPMVIFRLKDIVKSPLYHVLRGVVSAGRSSAFLATFVSGYMFLTSAHRRLLDLQFADMKSDHKLVYWIIGFFSSWSVLVEKKSRRSELALYALPRGADSIYHIMCQHKVAAKFKHGELLLFATAMAIIMYYHENEQDTVSPLLNSILLPFLSSK